MHFRRCLFNLTEVSFKDFGITNRKPFFNRLFFCTFVSITFHPSRCGKDICKKKQPTPQKKVNQLFMFFSLILILFVCYISIAVSICKIYREKTIEVGVYIDRHLYKNMEEVFPIDINHTFGSVCTSYHPPLQEHEGGIIYLLTVINVNTNVEGWFKFILIANQYH